MLALQLHRGGALPSTWSVPTVISLSDYLAQGIPYLHLKSSNITGSYHACLALREVPGSKSHTAFNTESSPKLWTKYFDEAHNDMSFKQSQHSLLNTGQEAGQGLGRVAQFTLCLLSLMRPWAQSPQVPPNKPSTVAHTSNPSI